MALEQPELQFTEDIFNLLLRHVKSVLWRTEGARERRRCESDGGGGVGAGASGTLMMRWSEGAPAGTTPAQCMGLAHPQGYTPLVGVRGEGGGGAANQRTRVCTLPHRNARHAAAALETAPMSNACQVSHRNESTRRAARGVAEPLDSRTARRMSVASPTRRADLLSNPRLMECCTAQARATCDPTRLLLKDPGRGGGGGWPALADPPTHPPTSGKKMEFIKGAGNLRPI